MRPRNREIAKESRWRCSVVIWYNGLMLTVGIMLSLLGALGGISYRVQDHWRHQQALAWLENDDAKGAIDGEMSTRTSTDALGDALTTTSKQSRSTNHARRRLQQSSSPPSETAISETDDPPKGRHDDGPPEYDVVADDSLLTP